MCNTLLGGAIGDALGMPFETKLVNDPRLIEWDGKTFLPSEHHGLKAGQFTDDGQMQQMIAESLITNHGFNPQDLSERYVEWMVSGRARGYGKTTLLAISNLLEGKSYQESGVPGSYGNGTAMRSAPIGVYFRDDLKEVVGVCKVDSGITHASEEAEAGSIAVAYAAALAAQDDLEDLLERVHEVLPDSKVKSILYSLGSLVNAKHIPATAALRVLGTKADVRQTVPSALYCFLRFRNYHDAILAAIKAGGDTDTTAAIVGGLFGAKLGMKAIDPTFYGVEDFDRLVELDSQLYNRSNGSFLLTGSNSQF